MSFLRHLLPTWKRRLEARDKANGAILYAIDKELKEAEIDAIEGKLTMSLDTSYGIWLDLYGKLFGVIRRDDESDDEYRQRIISYVLLERGTIPAIIEAIRNFLQDYESHIEIYEPYTNIFYTNKSKLNGKDHLLGNYYTFAVIDIRFSRPFPRGIMEVINAFKPAGVRVHLTYRPSAHNPEASMIELPLASSEVYTTERRLHIMNGMNDYIRGHLNLTKRARDEDGSGLFTTNKSSLNSLDRLAGSFSAVNPSYNLASATNVSLDVDDDTIIADILNETDPFPADFYYSTGENDDQYAIYSFLANGEANNYVHYTMDLGTYLNREYATYLREVEPSGSYNKNTYLSLVEKPVIQYSLRTTAPVTRPVGIQTQLFNLSENEWQTVDTSSTGYRRIAVNIELDDLEPFITSDGLLFTRMLLTPESDITTCDLHLYFFEVGFNKHIDIRPTIKPYTPEVSSSVSEIPI